MQNNNNKPVDLNASQEIDKKKRTICSTDLEMKFKIVLVGDSNVGKTSIFWRYIEDYYEDDQLQESTVTMVDFRMKNQIIDSDLVKLYLWDTAGQERYRSVISTYFKGAHAIIGVFDVTQPESFQSLSTHWIKQCREKSGNAIFVLVGNKSDLLKDENKYSESEDQNNNNNLDKVLQQEKQKIQQFCDENKVKFVQISAKTGEGIEDLFLNLAMEIRDKFFLQQQKPKQKDNNNKGGNNLDNVESKNQQIQDDDYERPSFTLNSGNKKNNNNKETKNNSNTKKQKKDGCC